MENIATRRKIKTNAPMVQLQAYDESIVESEKCETEAAFAGMVEDADD